MSNTADEVMTIEELAVYLKIPGQKIGNTASRDA
jgi:hypothetical protein